MGKLKLGIPRALLYYFYYPFWEKLFSELDIELIVSNYTSREQLDKGIKYSISEICVPIKVYIGHVLDLINQGVDYVYIPRIISIKKNIFLCPKFLGLPDMIKNSIPEIENKILTHQITAKDDSLAGFKNYLGMADKLNISKWKLFWALQKANSHWQEHRKTQLQVNIDKKVLTIALIGYVYNIYDRFINMDLLRHLREMGINIVTFEMVDSQIIEQEVKLFPKPMFWEFTNKLLGAGYHFLKSPDIDGIIYVSAFGCGPDSILGSFLEIDANQANKPFMTLRIDEQTGESHLLTRIEAFVDLLKLKKS